MKRKKKQSREITLDFWSLNIFFFFVKGVNCQSQSHIKYQF